MYRTHKLAPIVVDGGVEEERVNEIVFALVASHARTREVYEEQIKGLTDENERLRTKVAQLEGELQNYQS